MKKLGFLFAAVAIFMLTQACDDDTKKPRYVSGGECRTLTLKGECDGDNRVFCDATNKVAIEPCREGCKVDVDGTSYCPISCGTVTEKGVCSSNNLRSYCQNNQLKTETCKSGTQCSVINEMARCAMVEKKYVKGEACGDLTDKGVCQDNNVFYCKDGVVNVDTCDAGCKITSANEAWCKCGAVTADGICDQGDVLFCTDEGVLSLEECKNDTECKVTNNRAECASNVTLPVVGQPCGTLTEVGMCKDSTNVLYCASGTVYQSVCINNTVCKFNKNVNLNNGKGEYGCYLSPCGAETEAGRCDGDTLIWCNPNAGDPIVEKFDCTKNEQECKLVVASNAYNCV